MDAFMNFLRPQRSILDRLCVLAKSDWKQGDEDDQWATRAIESLLKKFKKEKGHMDTHATHYWAEKLEKALISRSKQSECVTILRSLDGRLQVNHRKGIPHVIYCRVWRWPDLQTHQELKSEQCCQYPYSNKQTNICINPYHYDRIECAQVLPPVLVPRRSEKLTFVRSVNFFKPHRAAGSSSSSTSSSNNTGMGPPLPVGPYPMPVIYNPNAGMAGPMVDETALVGSAYASPPPASGSKVTSMPESPYSYFSEEEKMQVDDNLPIMQQQQLLLQRQQMHAAHQQTLFHNGNMSIDVNMNPSVAPTPFPLPDCADPEFWCTISYYELNSRVGEIFNVPFKTHTVTVDGYTDPSVNRFCLGRFNNVNRSKNVQKTRDSIGKGVELINHQGRIYARCLSDYAVFVQSVNCNLFREFHRSTICKIPPGYMLKIFDMNYFKQQLVDAMNKAMTEKCPDKLFEVEKMCFVRMSFVRGWGAEYQRQNITSTPCWIEIRLNQPFQWYDKTVLQPGLGMYKMSSMT